MYIKMLFQKRLKLFLRSFCQSYDMKQHSTKVFRDIVNALGSFIQSLFLVPPTGNTATANQAGNVQTVFISLLVCSSLLGGKSPASTNLKRPSTLRVEIFKY